MTDPKPELIADTEASDGGIMRGRYVAPNVTPFEGSCDCCSESPKRIVHVDPDTETYTCDGCVEGSAARHVSVNDGTLDDLIYRDASE